MATEESNEFAQNASDPSTKISRELPRENLVQTAVAFLQNPRVRGSPLVQKKTFLREKGLTEQEIEQAVDRAIAHQVAAPIQPFILHSQPGVVRETSLWNKWKDMCTSLVAVGATFYGCYHLYRCYIEPLIIGKQREDEDKVERHLQELNQSLSHLRHSLAAVESALSRNTDKVEEEEVRDALSLAEIKSDVATIKSLLLSRKQFPSIPTGIPTWQMKSNDESPLAEEVVCLDGEQLNIADKKTAVSLLT